MSKRRRQNYARNGLQNTSISRSPFSVPTPEWGQLNGYRRYNHIDVDSDVYIAEYKRRQFGFTFRNKAFNAFAKSKFIGVCVEADSKYLYVFFKEFDFRQVGFTYTPTNDDTPRGAITRHIRVTFTEEITEILTNSILNGVCNFDIEELPQEKGTFYIRVEKKEG